MEANIDFLVWFNYYDGRRDIMVKDPIQQVLKDLKGLREWAHADISKLPAPYPVKDVLEVIDKVFRSAEEELGSERYFIGQWLRRGKL